MKLDLITLATVKTQLGITGTDDDTSISAMIPIVSSDVRRILNNNFDHYIVAAFSSSAATIDIDYNVTHRYDPYRGVESLPVGQVVYHPNIPDDTYIESYNPLTGLYTLSATPTDSGDYIYPTLTIAQWSAVSKMIWYRIGKLVKTDVNDSKVNSESYGPVSKSYAESEINRRWNYPQSLIDDLGPRLAKVG